MAIQFKTARCEKEFLLLHPRVRTLVAELDSFSAQQKFPNVVVTHVHRTPVEQKAIYKGAKDFSWHMVYCACDLRNNHYSPAQLDRVVEFLRTQTQDEAQSLSRLRKLLGRIVRPPKPTWEILAHDVGRGEHIHVGLRDTNWRNTFPDAPHS